MRQRVIRVLAAAVAAGLAVAGPIAPTALAVDQSKGYPGFCTSAVGVTVVVDFQQLGGDTIVRCNPRTTRGTGLDALKGAGFQIEGVVRWGEGFVCRVENRPSAVEEIPITGRGDYRELCRDTPPGAAYWSYWHAGNNCQWEYSQWGVKNRDFIPGGFEGWSFSLDATANSNPRPRVAAVRPGTGGAACDAPDEPPPNSGDPGAQQPRPGGGGGDGGRPGSGDGDGSGSGDGGGPGSGTGDGADPTAGPTAGSGPGAVPPPLPRTPGAPKPTADPSDDVAFTGGEQARDVDDVLREQSGASDSAPWAAVGAVLALGAGAWLIARRRSLARDA